MIEALFRKLLLFVHWEMFGDAKLATTRPVEVVRYNPLFVHCPTLVVAKFREDNPVEVVR